MKWTEATEQNCPIAQSLAILGDCWTLLIILNAFLEMACFNFSKKIAVTRHVLAERLARLVDMESSKRKPIWIVSSGFEYVLTLEAQNLKPILIALVEWGVNWTEAEVSTQIMSKLKSDSLL